MAGRPQRGAPLSKELIVAAALRLARAGGLEKVTMRDLAAELQVALGSVYHHVHGQADLQAAVVEHVLSSIPLPSELPGTPRQRLIRNTQLIQQALEDNPGLTAAVIAAAPDTAIGQKLRYDVRATFRDAGLGKLEMQRAFLALEWLWLGSRVTTGPHSYDKTTFDRAMNALLDGFLKDQGS